MSAEEMIAIRRRLDLTQATMARELRASAKAVQKWEQGERRPSGAVVRLYELLRDGIIQPEPRRPRERGTRAAPK